MNHVKQAYKELESKKDTRALVHAVLAVSEQLSQLIAFVTQDEGPGVGQGPTADVAPKAKG